MAKNVFSPNRLSASREEDALFQREAEIFAENLEYVRARAAGEAEGVLGPESLTWEILREVAVLMGGGRALVLQLAHPAVAAGVDQHSRFREDPIGRARRTFSSMYQIVFGDLSSALKSARRIFAIHGRVRGRMEGRGAEEGGAYRATDPALLLWVLATLIDSAHLAFEAFIRPLREREKREGYEEAKLLGMLMGIPRESFPATWEDFQRYFTEMTEGSALDFGGKGGELCRLLFQAPFGLGEIDRFLTASFLSPRQREALGLTVSEQEQRYYALWRKVSSETFIRLPKTLRFVPAYHQAMVRLSKGRRGVPSLGARLVARLGGSVALPFGLPPARAR